MSVHLTIFVDGSPQVKHQWGGVLSVGDHIRLGVGGPNERTVRVVRPPVWFNSTSGDCCVDLHCKEDRA